MAKGVCIYIWRRFLIDSERAIILVMVRDCDFHQPGVFVRKGEGRGTNHKGQTEKSTCGSGGGAL